ncbi:MAG: hypothetical protein GF310_11115 [candidate division Zixibacteria bacterium]|nr:hypothetical protein [candidate division Zixibacteria bacterium]
MVAGFVFIINAGLLADVPHFFSYQGRLTDSLGNPLNATVELDFRIYADEYGNTMLWKEVHPSVQVINGLFDVFLGSGKALPDSIFDGSVLWLGIMVDDGPTLEPLTPFIASPYSFRSIHADTAEYAMNAPGGVDSWSQNGSYVLLADNDDSVGIGVLGPVEKLHVGGNLQIGAYGDIKFSPENTRIDCESNNLHVKAQSDLYLEPYDDLYVRRRDGGSSWAHFDNSTQRLGIGVLNPPYKLTVNGDISIANSGESKYHINYYQGGLNIAETGVQDRRIHISDGGNVGIGTAGAEEKLHVYGNAKIKDTIKVGAFEEDAIDRHNIVDEVGIASAVSSSLCMLSPSWYSCLSREITVPTSGYILAMGCARIELIHLVSGETGAEVGFSGLPNDINEGVPQEFLLDFNVSAGNYYVSIPFQRLFSVSQGTHTIHMIARESADNNAWLKNRQMTLLFIPTVYASKRGVTTSDPEDNISDAGISPDLFMDLASDSKATRSHATTISSSHNTDLSEQIKTLTAQIEELKRRMEAYEKK